MKPNYDDAHKRSQTRGIGSKIRCEKCKMFPPSWLDTTDGNGNLITICRGCGTWHVSATFTPRPEIGYMLETPAVVGSYWTQSCASGRISARWRKDV